MNFSNYINNANNSNYDSSYPGQGIDVLPSDGEGAAGLIQTISSAILPYMASPSSSSIVSAGQPSIRQRISIDGSEEDEIEEAFHGIQNLLSRIRPESLREVLNWLDRLPSQLAGPIKDVIQLLLNGAIGRKDPLTRQELYSLVQQVPDDLILTINKLSSFALQMVPEEMRGMLAPFVELLNFFHRVRASGFHIVEEEKEDQQTFLPEGHPWFKEPCSPVVQEVLEAVTLPMARGPSKGAGKSYSAWLEYFEWFLRWPGSQSLYLQKAYEAICALCAWQKRFDEFYESLPQVLNPHQDKATQEAVGRLVGELQNEVRDLQAGACTWLTLSEAGICPLVLRIRREEDWTYTLTLFSVGDELGRMGDAYGLLSLHDKGAIQGKAVQLNFFERRGVSEKKLCGSQFFREVVWQCCVPNTILGLANTDELSTRKGLFENYLDGENAPRPSLDGDSYLFYEKSRSQAESFVGALLGKASPFDLLKTIVRHLYLETAHNKGTSLQEAYKEYRYLRFQWTTRVLVGALQPKRQREDGTFSSRGALAQRLLCLGYGASRRDIQLVKRILRAVRRQAWRLAQEVLSPEEKETFLRQVASALAPAENFLRQKTKEREISIRGESLVAQGIFDVEEDKQVPWQVPKMDLPKGPSHGAVRGNPVNPQQSSSASKGSKDLPESYRERYEKALSAGMSLRDRINQFFISRTPLSIGQDGNGTILELFAEMLASKDIEVAEKLQHIDYLLSKFYVWWPQWFGSPADPGTKMISVVAQSGDLDFFIKVVEYFGKNYSHVSLDTSLWLALPTPTGRGDGLWERCNEAQAQKLLVFLNALLNASKLDSQGDGSVALMNAVAICETLLKKIPEAKMEAFRFDYASLIYVFVKEPTRYGQKKASWPILSCAAHDKLQELLTYFVHSDDYALADEKMTTYQGQRHVRDQSTPKALRRTGRLEGAYIYNAPESPEPTDYLKSYVLRQPFPDIKPNLTRYAAQFIHPHDSEAFQTYYKAVRCELALENATRALSTLFSRTLPFRKIVERLEALSKMTGKAFTTTEENWKTMVKEWQTEFNTFIEEVVAAIDEDKIQNVFTTQMKEWMGDLSGEDQKALKEKIHTELEAKRSQIQVLPAQIEDRIEEEKLGDLNHVRSYQGYHTAALRRICTNFYSNETLFGNDGPIEPLASAEELFWDLAKSLGQAMTRQNFHIDIYQSTVTGSWHSKANGKGTKKGYQRPTMPHSQHFPLIVNPMVNHVSRLIVKVEEFHSIPPFHISEKVGEKVKAFLDIDIEERNTPYPSWHRIASIKELGHFPGQVSSEHVREGDFYRMEAGIFSDPDHAATLLYDFLSRWLESFGEPEFGFTKLNPWKDWIFSPVIYGQLSADMDLLRKLNLLARRGFEYYKEKGRPDLCSAFTQFSLALQRIYEYRLEHPHPQQKVAQGKIEFLDLAMSKSIFQEAVSEEITTQLANPGHSISISKKNFVGSSDFFIYREVGELLSFMTSKDRAVFPVVYGVERGQGFLKELATWLFHGREVLFCRYDDKNMVWTLDDAHQYTLSVANHCYKLSRADVNLPASVPVTTRCIQGDECASMSYPLARLPTNLAKLLPQDLSSVDMWVPIGRNKSQNAYIEIPGRSHGTPHYYRYDQDGYGQSRVVNCQNGDVLLGHRDTVLGPLVVWSSEDDRDNIIILDRGHRHHASLKSYHFKDYGLIIEKDPDGKMTLRAFPGYAVEKDASFTDEHLLQGAGRGYLVLVNKLKERKVLVFDEVEGKGRIYVYDIQGKDLPSYGTETQGRKILVPASIDSALYAAMLCVRRGHYGRAVRYLQRHSHTVSPYTQRQRDLLLALWQEARGMGEVAAKAIALRAVHMLEDNRLSYDPGRSCEMDWGDFDKVYQEYTLFKGSLRKTLALHDEERLDLLRFRYLSALHGEGRQPGLLNKVQELGKVGASIVNGSMLDEAGLLHKSEEEGEENAGGKIAGVSGMPIAMRQELQTLLKKTSIPSVQEQKLTRMCEVLPVMAFEKGQKKIDMKNLVKGYERRLHAKAQLDFATLPPALHMDDKTFIAYFGQFYYIAKKGTSQEKEDLQDYLNMMRGNMSLVVHGVTDAVSGQDFTLYYWLANKVLAAPDLYPDIDADYRRKIAWQDRLLELRERLKQTLEGDEQLAGMEIDGIEVFFNYYDTVRLGDEADIAALRERMKVKRQELKKLEEERKKLLAAIEAWDSWKGEKPDETPWAIDRFLGWIGWQKERIQSIKQDYDKWKKARPEKKISFLDYLRLPKWGFQQRSLEVEVSAYEALEALLKEQDRPHQLPHLDDVDKDALRNGTPLEEARGVALAWSVSGFDIRQLWRLRHMGMALLQAGKEAILGQADGIDLHEHYANATISISSSDGSSTPILHQSERWQSLQVSLQERAAEKVLGSSRWQQYVSDSDVEELIAEPSDRATNLLSLFDETKPLLLEEGAKSLEGISEEGFAEGSAKAKFKEIQKSVHRYNARRSIPATLAFARDPSEIPEMQDLFLEETQCLLLMAQERRQEFLEVAHKAQASDVQEDFAMHLDRGKVTWESLSRAYLTGTYEAYRQILGPFADEKAIEAIDQAIFEHDLCILYAKMWGQLSDALGKAYAAWEAAGRRDDDPEYLEYLAEAKGLVAGLYRRGSLEERLPEFEGFSPQEIDKIRRVFLRFEAREGKILRPKQLRLLGKALSALKRGEETVIFEAGTGTGKSKVLELLLGILGPACFQELSQIAFGVYTWPSSLAAVNKNDMHSQAMHVLDARVEALHFAYRYFNKEKEGVFITLYEKFVRAVREKKLINSKPEDWQSLELAVIEKLADEQACKEIPHLIHMGLEMLRMLRHGGLQLPDETQITCGPKRLVKHRLGEKTSLKEYDLDVLYVLHQALLACSEGSSDFDWDTGRGTALFHEYAKAVHEFEESNPQRFGFPENEAGKFLSRVATDALDRLIKMWKFGHSGWSFIIQKHQNAVLCYISDKRCPPPAQWNDEKIWPAPLRLALDGLRGQLTDLLPKTLPLSYLSAFGESPDPKKPYMVFWDKGSPQKDPSVELSLELETGNQTLRGWLAKGLDQDLVQRLLKLLATEAENERKLHPQVAIRDTRAGKLFEEAVAPHYPPGKVPSLISFAKEAAHIDGKLFNAIRRNRSMILHAVTYLVLPQIPVYEKTIESNSANLLSQFKGRLGGSATPGHRLQYGLETFFIPDEDEVLGEIISFQDSMLARGNVRGYSEGNARSILQQITALVRANDEEEGVPPVRELVDLTGLLNGIEPEEFAHAVQELYREDPMVAGVLLFAKSEGQEERLVMCDLHQGGQEPAEHSKLSPTRYFVYINQAGSVGTDTKMHPVSRGFVTVDTQITLEDGGQANGRMRNKGRGQEVVFLFPKKELALLLGKEEGDADLDEIASRGLCPEDHRKLLETLRRNALVTWIRNQVVEEQEINEAAFRSLVFNEVRNQMMQNILAAETLEEQSRFAKDYKDFLETEGSVNSSKLWGGSRKELPIRESLLAMVAEAQAASKKYLQGKAHAQVKERLGVYREAIDKITRENQLDEEKAPSESPEDRPFVLPKTREGKSQAAQTNVSANVNANVDVSIQVQAQQNVNSNMQVKVEHPSVFPLRRHHATPWKPDLDLFGTNWYSPEGTFHLRAAVVSKAVRSFDVVRSMASGRPGEFLSAMSAVRDQLPSWKKVVVFSLAGSVLLTLCSIGLSIGMSYGSAKFLQAIKAAAQRAMAVLRTTKVYAWMQQHPVQSTLVGISSAVLIVAGGYKIHQCRSTRNKAKDRGVGIYLLDTVAKESHKLFGDKILVTNNYVAKKPRKFFEPIQDLYSQETAPLVVTILVAIQQDDVEHPYDFRYIVGGQRDLEDFVRMLKEQKAPEGCRVSIGVRYFNSRQFMATSNNWPEELSEQALKQNQDFAVLDNLVRAFVAGQVSGYQEVGIPPMQERIAQTAKGRFDQGAARAFSRFEKAARFKPKSRADFKGSQLHVILSNDRRLENA